MAKRSRLSQLNGRKQVYISQSRNKNLVLFVKYQKFNAITVKKGISHGKYINVLKPFAQLKFI